MAEAFFTNFRARRFNKLTRQRDEVCIGREGHRISIALDNPLVPSLDGIPGCPACLFDELFGSVSLQLAGSVTIPSYV